MLTQSGANRTSSPKAPPPTLPPPTQDVAGPSSPRTPPVRLPTQHPTVAEAYAQANQPRRDKSKQPLLEWFTRKLGGAARRAVDEHAQTVPGTGSSKHHMPQRRGSEQVYALTAKGKGWGAAPPKETSPPRDATFPRPGAAARPITAVALSPVRRREPSFSIASPDSRSFLSRQQSVTRSLTNTERDRRREANNPYPSLPLHLHRASTIDSEAITHSVMSRSRASSFTDADSMAVVRPRLSLAFTDDGSVSGRVPWTADDNASLRPIAPSHTNSPAPSISVRSHSRSVSASLLSPGTALSPHAQSPVFSRPSTQQSISLHSTEPDLEDPLGLAGRRDSASRRDSGSRRDSASTKPTTVLSFDSGPHVGHIAQVSNSPVSMPSPSLAGGVSGLRRTGGSVGRDLMRSFVPADSSPGPATPGPATPATGSADVTPSPASPVSMDQAGIISPLQESAAIDAARAPKHTLPNPKDNPRPLAPPEANASTLTLASSTFALVPPPNSMSAHPPSIHQSRENPLARGPRPISLATSPSVTFAEPSAYNTPVVDRPGSYVEYPGSTHLSTHATSLRTGGWGPGGARADRDASVRAVRRKGSWESYESGWSWRPGMMGGPGGPGGPMATDGASMLGQRVLSPPAIAPDEVDLSVGGSPASPVLATGAWPPSGQTDGGPTYVPLQNGESESFGTEPRFERGGEGMAVAAW